MRQPKRFIKRHIRREKNGTWTASEYLYVAVTGSRSKIEALRRLRGWVKAVIG